MADRSGTQPVGARSGFAQPEPDRLEEVWREQAPHVLAALLRRYGDLPACEDAVQEALLAAATQWPTQGRPDDPRGWLVRVASRRLIDQRRVDTARARREERESRVQQLDRRAAPSAEDEALGRALLPSPAGGDDTLGLLLLCCHPSLTPSSQVALTLRAVGGLSTRQVAAAFLVPETTMAQRISRARATLRDAGARLDEVPEGELPARLAAVLRVLLLIFTEGHATSLGDQLVDRTLTTEALRLTRHLVAQVPDHAEAQGLLALMLLTDARRRARTTGAGDLIPLGEQDRTRWDGDQIAEGVAILEEVLPQGLVGPYQLQAAIAAVHAEAPSAAQTDWPQICALYRMLQQVEPGDVVTLNLAVAVGMASGPAAGLRTLEPLLASATMRRHHRTHAVRAHLRELAGQPGAARESYLLAARLTASRPEQRYLLRRAEGVAPPPGSES